MNRRFSLAAVFFFLSLAELFSETILMAPVIVYDKDSAVIEQEQNPSEKLYDTISCYWFEGLVTFRLLPAETYGQIYTALDANRACTAEEAKYILFGYMQKNEGSWLAHVKLYDCKAKKISREFYASDDSSHYERFLSILSSHIIDGLEDVTGLSRTASIKEKLRPFELKIPLSAFYWSPVDRNWNSKLTGIAGGDIGLHIYPPQPKITIGRMLLDFSLRPMASYSYAMGKDGSYSLDYNGISFVLPLCIQLHFSVRNAVYAGCGAYYEIELINVTPKYESREFHYQNMFGLEPFIGYEFSVNRIVNLFTEVRADIHLSSDMFIAVKPALGVSFTVCRGKK
ncbi:MAG: hypothetical protein J6K96_00645 [Treponema sp.]|nr:hypothetical protein [Treponema sp.]